MKMTMPIAASLFVFLVAAPAWAACDDELATLDSKVQAQATKAVATSGGGQGVSAKRSSEAIASRDSDAPAKTGQQTGPAGGAKEAQATSQAAQAGGAGDRVMQAKASINEARVAKGKGDEAGCMAAVTKAKGQLEK